MLAKLKLECANPFQSLKCGFKGFYGNVPRLYKNRICGQRLLEILSMSSKLQCKHFIFWWHCLMKLNVFFNEMQGPEDFEGLAVIEKHMFSRFDTLKPTKILWMEKLQGLLFFPLIKQNEIFLCILILLQLRFSLRINSR